MADATSCSKCKREMATDAKFCPACGAKRRKDDVTIGQVVVVVIIFAVMWVWLRSPHEAPAQTKVASIESMPQSRLTYSEVEANARRLSEINFKDYAKNIEGKRVDWTGRVIEVEETLRRQCKIWIDMDGTGVQDVYVSTDCGRAKLYNVGDKIRVDGVIDSAITLLKSAVITLRDDPVLYTFDN